MTTKPASNRPFWIGVALGAPIILLGARGILANAGDTEPTELARFIGGSAIVHDAVVLPFVLAVGWVGHRLLPTWLWRPARWALMTTAIVLVVSRPFVARWGYNDRNPTALSRNYGQGVAVALLVVWAATLVWAALERRSERRTGAPPT